MDEHLVPHPLSATPNPTVAGPTPSIRHDNVTVILVFLLHFAAPYVKSSGYVFTAVQKIVGAK
jgi:hypothetical protein